jgi:hypothetical protein
MPAPHWFSLFVLLSAAGCGRLGVQLHLLDIDASTQRDAGQPLSAGRAGRESGSGSVAGTTAAADSGIDAGPPYQGDAATDLTMDATVSMPLDAGNPASCGGARRFELCWYLAQEDTSCNSECANKGGFDPRALSYIGTAAQGGSAEQCEQVLTALGEPGPVSPGTQQIGLGCHLWNNNDRWWLQSPTFSPNAATPEGTGARITCACQN